MECWILYTGVQHTNDLLIWVKGGWILLALCHLLSSSVCLGSRSSMWPYLGFLSWHAAAQGMEVYTTQRLDVVSHISYLLHSVQFYHYILLIWENGKMLHILGWSTFPYKCYWRAPDTVKCLCSAQDSIKLYQKRLNFIILTKIQTVWRMPEKKCKVLHDQKMIA